MATVAAVPRRNLLDRLHDCISSIDDQRGLDDLLFTDSLAEKGHESATRWDAESAISTLKRAHSAIDTGMITCEQLPESQALRVKLRDYFRIADCIVGPAVVNAESALVKGEIDAAFRYARTPILRLRGELGDQLEILASAISNRRFGKSTQRDTSRWPRGHKPTRREKRILEHDARQILRRSPLIRRDELARLLRVSTGYASKTDAWLTIHPPTVKPASLPAIPTNALNELGEPQLSVEQQRQLAERLSRAPLPDTRTKIAGGKQIGEEIADEMAAEESIPRASDETVSEYIESFSDRLEDDEFRDDIIAEFDGTKKTWDADRLEWRHAGTPPKCVTGLRGFLISR
ncbi:hypothetical protein PLANPX_2124 [Lacipirellula parvula]|uniref:Uncharacterized protein n=2 Tax=Lacipirellula parvula TaxID=2650471 RepID=A0A5K7X9H2_9BACT|nr:hypothetical protein PLANPX_2124 [Lacipirellula parvula]